MKRTLSQVYDQSKCMCQVFLGSVTFQNHVLIILLLIDYQIHLSPQPGPICCKHSLNTVHSIPTKANVNVCLYFPIQYQTTSHSPVIHHIIHIINYPFPSLTFYFIPTTTTFQISHFTVGVSSSIFTFMILLTIEHN